MTALPAIEVYSLGKEYLLGGADHYQASFREMLTDVVAAPFRKLRRLSGKDQAQERIWALKDISFAVQPGEVVGIIGRNGAGKSTLLKILSRITEPTEGRVVTRGRIASLLEVGTGFHQELTGRENIFLNGAILGMKRSEIHAKFDDIVDFAEIDRFIDTPVKRYSSGMYVRLAFAVAAHLEPEILVVDEVLAVGDIAFQKKCLGKMKDVAGHGRTVLFVSHNMGAINQLCPTAIWLEQGMLHLEGPSREIVSEYTAAVTADAEEGYAELARKEQVSSQLLSLRLLDPAGVKKTAFECDHPVKFEMLYEVHERVRGLYGYLAISTEDQTTVLVSDSHDIGNNVLGDLAPGRHVIEVSLPARSLGPGKYNVYLNFTDSLGNNIDSPGIVCRFQMTDTTTRRGDRRGGYFSTLLDWKRVE